MFLKLFLIFVDFGVRVPLSLLRTPEDLLGPHINEVGEMLGLGTERGEDWWETPEQWPGCPLTPGPCAPRPARRQPPGESDMAVSDALLPSFSTFASGPAGREKTLRPAGAPTNVSVTLVPCRFLQMGWGGWAESGGHQEPLVRTRIALHWDSTAFPRWLLGP